MYLNIYTDNYAGCSLKTASKPQSFHTDFVCIIIPVMPDKQMTDISWFCLLETSHNTSCIWEWLSFSFLWLNWNNKLSESLACKQECRLTQTIWPRFWAIQNGGWGGGECQNDVFYHVLGPLSPEHPCWTAVWSSAAWHNKSLDILMVGCFFFFFYCGDEYGFW